jgi:type IV secretory pathway VirB10-like protein
MEMNIEIQQRVAGRVLLALEHEKLMNKEAAEIFGFSPIYLSFIKRRTEFHKTPRKAWEAMHDWVNAGVPLRGYKSPLNAAEEVAEAEQAAVEAEALTKQQEQQQAAEAPAPEAPPLTKEEKKARKAARIRELYERSKPPKKGPKPEDVMHPDPDKQPEPGAQPGQPDTLIISREGDKVDLSKISLRTGTTIFTAEVTDNEIIIRFPLVRQEEKK